MPAVAVVLQEVGVGGLGAGGDNGPAHTPASRGTHMHACMLGTTCMHGALLPAPLTLECPDRAHGRTASEDVRHSRASPLGTQMLFFFLHTCLHLPFLISGCIPSPSTVGLGSLSLCVCLPVLEEITMLHAAPLLLCYYKSPN